MRQTGKIAICLAGGLVLNASLRADSALSSDNPYAPVVVRNVFGLNPPPVVQVRPDPPPRITPNGIMTIFGQLQVLFKVAGTPKLGNPTGEEPYILSEGERQDDIEVTKIDEKSGMVTFNNHGVVQELPLANAPTISMPATVVNQNQANGSVSGGNSQLANGGGNGSYNPNSGSNFQPTPSRGGYVSPQSQITIDPEAQKVMIVAQHLKAIQDGDPIAPIFPPTDLDGQAGIGPNGASSQPQPDNP